MAFGEKPADQRFVKAAAAESLKIGHPVIEK
jgi:hypothetical protein